MTNAKDYFLNGYSCSESIVKSFADKGLCPVELLPCATGFSGGMSSGCVCGALAAAQMVAGYNFGKNNSKENIDSARKKAKIIHDEFVKRNKVTCCRILSKGLEGMERKHHCCKMVNDAEEILENIFSAEQVNV